MISDQDLCLWIAMRACDPTLPRQLQVVPKRERVIIVDAGDT
jgi:hypothetical protein